MTHLLGHCGLRGLSPSEFEGINEVQKNHHANVTDRTLGNGWPPSITEILLLYHHLPLSAGPAVGTREVGSCPG